MSYRKREIAHWNQGKGCKGVRKAKERQYTEREIEEQIAELEENFRTRHYSRTPNKLAQLEHRVTWYEQTIARHPEGSFVHYLRDALEKAKKQLAKLRDKNE